MDLRYPEIDPYDCGMLDAGDGNRLYWEQCGNPDGKPALVLHGGPGSGCSEGMRRWFDPARYRIVLFDQRNCGRSAPLASDVATDLTTNTTRHLIADIERLRNHLGIERWLVWGTSWGSTLAFAYAERFPERVSEMVHVAVTTTTREEVDWLTRGVGRFLPEAWTRFRDALPEDMRDGNLAAAYARLLASPDPDTRASAAAAWCHWEDALVDPDPAGRPAGSYAWDRYEDPAFRYGWARIVTHYFSNAAWLDEGELLRKAHRLAGIPGVLIHGRLDLGSPLATAWTMAQAWPDAELVVIEQGGHGSGDGTAEAILAATNRFADRR